MKQTIKNLRAYHKKLGFSTTIHYLLQRCLLRKNALIQLRLRGVKNNIYLRNKSFDIHIFFQIFINEELGYVKDQGEELMDIIDAGANIGLATIYFKRYFPNAKVLAIEPAPINIELLKKNLSGYEDITIMEAALTGSRKTVNIINPEDNYASFRVDENEGLIGKIDAFPLSYFLQLFKNDKVSLVKMDIEGQEREVFEYTPDDTLAKVSLFAIEIHDGIHADTSQIVEKKLSSFTRKLTEGEYIFFKANIS